MNIVWRSIPDDRESLEQRILTELANDSSLRRFSDHKDYRDLIYHIILLTGDMNGPSITIWGDEQDREIIHAEFDKETHWESGVE